MKKNSLAIIVIGCLVTGSSFASPLHVNQIFMKNQMMKSSLVSKNHTQNSPSRFSGTWTGICTRDGEENDSVKIRIEDDDNEFSIIDLINEGGNETHSFNVIETESRTGKDSYESFTSRLTRINDNTISFEGTEVYANQLPTPYKEKTLVSGVFTSLLTVNNNQLIIETKSKRSNARSDEGRNESVDNCILNRAG